MDGTVCYLCVLHIFVKKLFGAMLYFNKMEFGKRCKEARKQCGLSQKQVAEKLGIEQSNVSDWENNVSRPEYENLIALARLYNETLETLLGIEL